MSVIHTQYPRTIAQFNRGRHVAADKARSLRHASLSLISPGQAMDSVITPVESPPEIFMSSEIISGPKSDNKFRFIGHGQKFGGQEVLVFW